MAPAESQADARGGLRGGHFQLTRGPVGAIEKRLRERERKAGTIELGSRVLRGAIRSPYPCPGFDKTLCTDEAARAVPPSPVRNPCQCVTWPLRFSAGGVGGLTVIGQRAIRDYRARMNSGRDDAAVPA